MIVESLLTKLTEQAADDRRRRERFPTSHKMLLLPVASNGSILFDNRLFVIGEDLSRTGVRLSHDVSLEHDGFLLVFRTHDGEFVVQAEKAWTQTTAIGLHETGVKLVRKLVTPPSFSN